MRLSRRHYWRFRRDRCEHCRVGLKPNQVRESWVDWPIVIVFFAAVVLAIKGIVSWWHTATIVTLIVGIGWIVFPYLTIYDRTTEGPQCLGCGYDLKGVASDRCPECGRATRGETAAI